MGDQAFIQIIVQFLMHPEPEKTHAGRQDRRSQRSPNLANTDVPWANVTPGIVNPAPPSVALASAVMVMNVLRSISILFPPFASVRVDFFTHLVISDARGRCLAPD